MVCRIQNNASRNANWFVSAVCLVLILNAVPAFAGGPVHHDLTVTLVPGAHRITAKDVVTFPTDFPDRIEFLLHAGLDPSSPTPGVRIVKAREISEAVPLEVFTLFLPSGMKSFVLEYQGTINHPLGQENKGQARGFQDTPGLISREGVYLSGASFWYPRLHETVMETFTLEVRLPSSWDAVSQGARTGHRSNDKITSMQWTSPEPQSGIFLVAGRYTEYTRSADGLQYMVFLRTPDEALAGTYLDATARYIELYRRLIGPYPYKKFALVENFWETGFGMPSFTLLGPKVVRLPFIINTSYPHEILHNWWGNSVYPDFRTGNWSEGITAYLADHLMKEQDGAGAEYRVTMLQKYRDYVLEGRDFPLSGFSSRHSSSSEAVGYGKSMMFFHQLRLELGDTLFIMALRSFYQLNQYRFADFDDIRRSFEYAAGKNLKNVFDQWITRTGAPEIKLTDAASEKKGDHYLITATMKQVQPGDAYHLRIPIAVTLEGNEYAFQSVVEMTGAVSKIELSLPVRPLRIDVDPEFDVFRKLDRDEIPPAVSMALGAKKMTILLPSAAAPDLLDAYRRLAADIGGSGPDEVEVRLDSEAGSMPADRAVMLLGWENRFAPEMNAALSMYDVLVNPVSLRINGQETAKKDHTFVFTAPLPKNRDFALALIASDAAGALPGLGRKLPHYGKYSYLVFEGREPVNTAKGRWPVLDSPMTVFIPGAGGAVQKVDRARLAARKPLAAEAAAFSQERPAKP